MTYSTFSFSGLRISSLAYNHVNRRYLRGENPIVADLVHNVSTYKGHDVCVQDFAAKHFNRQRIHLTEVKDTFQSVAAIHAYNRKLNDIEGNGYEYVFESPDALLNPGRQFVVAAYTIRNLMILSDLDRDIELVDRLSGHQVNQDFANLDI